MSSTSAAIGCAVSIGAGMPAAACAQNAGDGLAMPCLSGQKWRPIGVRRTLARLSCLPKMLLRIDFLATAARM